MLRFIPMQRHSAAFVEKFWSRVDQSGGVDSCWPWTASKDGNGYGKMKTGMGVTVRTHRLAFYFANGVDPGDQMVCHTCDNPPCCNPKHHFLGTNSDNQLDAVAKGRRVGREQDGEKNGNAKLSEEQIEAVKVMIRSGKTNMAIGRVFGVTHQAISRIRRGKAWGTEPLQPRYASLRR